MTMMASQITSLTIVFSTIYSGADQRKHQSSMSLAFVRGIHLDEFPVQKASKAENVSFDMSFLETKHVCGASQTIHMSSTRATLWPYLTTRVTTHQPGMQFQQLMPTSFQHHGKSSPAPEKKIHHRVNSLTPG